MSPVPPTNRGKSEALGVLLVTPGWSMMQEWLADQYAAKVELMLREDIDDNRRGRLAQEVRAYKAAIMWPQKERERLEALANKERHG